MQRIGGLFPEFCSFSNFLSAWRKTRQGCGFTPAGSAFFLELEKELFSLKSAFESGNWQPEPYRYFDIYDPKHRTIAVSSYKDRVVHHALVNILEPIYERSFIFDSYATRKHKGVHAAVFRAQSFLHQNEFYLKADVDKFFDSVNHDILLSFLWRKVKDTSFLEVCEKIIRHGGENGVGLPIGNRTSQFFANVYLDVLDHFLKDQCSLKGYVRYMDDFVLFENDQKRLKMLRRRLEDFLIDRLGLRLKANATFFNRRQNGLPFLGRRIFPGTIRFRTENLRRIISRMEQKEKQWEHGDISEETFLHSMNSYWAMLSYYPDTWPLRQALVFDGNKK